MVNIDPAVAANEVLQKQIQDISAGNSLQGDSFSKLNGMASPDDVNKFNDAMTFDNYVRRPDPNTWTTESSSTNRISSEGNNVPNTEMMRKSLINELGGYSDVSPEVLRKLEMQRSMIKEDITSEKFSKFFSVVKERLARINGLIDNLKTNPDLSQQKLMHIQYEVMEMGIVLDVASKVGDKGSQALQTLFRNQ